MLLSMTGLYGVFPRYLLELASEFVTAAAQEDGKSATMHVAQLSYCRCSIAWTRCCVMSGLQKSWTGIGARRRRRRSQPQGQQRQPAARPSAQSKVRRPSVTLLCKQVSTTPGYTRPLVPVHDSPDLKYV